MRTSQWVGAAVLVALGLGSVVAVGQAPAGSDKGIRPNSGAADEIDIAPETAWAVPAVFRNEEREFRTNPIHAGSAAIGTGSTKTLIYFPEPLASLIKRKGENEKLPFFHKLKRLENGEWLALIQVENFNPLLEQFTLYNVFNPDFAEVNRILDCAYRNHRRKTEANPPPAKPENAKPEPITDAEANLAMLLYNPKIRYLEKKAELEKWGVLVTVRPWPLMEAMLVIQNSRTKAVYCTATTGRLEQRSRTVEFNTRFSSDAYERMAEAEAEGVLEYKMIDLYRSRKWDAGEMTVSGKIATKAEVETILREMHLDAKSPHTAEMRNKFVQRIGARVEKVLRMTAPEMIKAFQYERLADHFFGSPQTFTAKDLEANPVLMAAVMEIITPAFKRTRTVDGKDATESNSKEKSTDTGVNASVSGGLPVFKLGIGASHSVRDVEAFQKATGTTYRLLNDEETYVFHSIDLWFLNQAVLEQSLDESTLIFSAVGPNTNFREGTPVSTEFTKEVAAQLMNDELAFDENIAKLQAERAENYKRLVAKEVECAEIRAKLKTATEAVLSGKDNLVKLLGERTELTARTALLETAIDVNNWAMSELRAMAKNYAGTPGGAYIPGYLTFTQEKIFDPTQAGRHQQIVELKPRAEKKDEEIKTADTAFNDEVKTLNKLRVELSEAEAAISGLERTIRNSDVLLEEMYRHR